MGNWFKKWKSGSTTITAGLKGWTTSTSIGTKNYRTTTTRKAGGGAYKTLCSDSAVGQNEHERKCDSSRRAHGEIAMSRKIDAGKLPHAEAAKRQKPKAKPKEHGSGTPGDEKPAAPKDIRDTDEYKNRYRPGWPYFPTFKG